MQRDSPRSDLPVDAVARGDIHFDVETPGWVAFQLDAGEPSIAPMECTPAATSCSPMRASGASASGIDRQGSSVHLLLTVMAGAGRARSSHGHQLDHEPHSQFIDLFTEAQVDAFLGLPPEPQDSVPARSVGQS